MSIDADATAARFELMYEELHTGRPLAPVRKALELS